MAIEATHKARMDDRGRIMPDGITQLLEGPFVYYHYRNGKVEAMGIGIETMGLMTIKRKLRYPQIFCGNPFKKI